MEIQGKKIPMPHLHDAAAQASGCFCSVCLELCNCKSFFVTHNKQNPAVTDKSLHVATYVCRSVQISCKKTAWLSYYQTRYERWTQTLWSLCRSLKQSICCCVCDKRGVYLIHKPHTCTVAAHHPILKYSSLSSSLTLIWTLDKVIIMLYSVKVENGTMKSSEVIDFTGSSPPAGHEKQCRLTKIINGLEHQKHNHLSTTWNKTVQLNS